MSLAQGWKGLCALTGPPGPIPEAWLPETTRPHRERPQVLTPRRLSTPTRRERTSASRARVSIGPVGTLAEGCSVAHQAPKAFPTGALPCELEGRARCASFPRSPGLAEPPRGGGPQTRVPGPGPPLRDKLLSPSPRWPREGVANRHRQSSKPPREECWWPSPGNGDRSSPARLRKGPEGQHGGRTCRWEAQGPPSLRTWLHWGLRELFGSQAQGSQPRPLASFQW